MKAKLFNYWRKEIAKGYYIDNKTGEYNMTEMAEDAINYFKIDPLDEDEVFNYAHHYCIVNNI